jgi:hypothetical protein
MAKAVHSKPHNAQDCFFCRNFHEFELPDHLLQELRANRVVLFAGAGVGTEGKQLLPSTLYSDILDELNCSDTPSFAELISQFCARPNGRAELLRRIRARFESIRAFPQLYNLATLFHRELSTLFMIDSIVTTNWDDYFEQEAGAIPFVTADDFVFWSTPGRKVFKIHGSINNLGSIVATKEDYDACYERLQSGVLGSSLKMMLATKTILYVGYSFKDEDFVRIHSLLKAEMGNLFPTSYIVTLDREGVERYRELGLSPIFTDATYFISVLKRHVIKDDDMLGDRQFAKIVKGLGRVQRAHLDLTHNTDFSKRPDVLYCAFYQDGLIQSFQRMLVLQNTGYYSHKCNVIHAIEYYEDLRKDMVRNKRYGDVAYIDGYTNALYFLLADDELRKALPVYYVYGAKDQPVTLREFERLRRQAKTLHKSAYQWVLKGRKRMTELVPQHMPYFQ